MTAAAAAPQTRYQTEDITREQIERSLDVVLARLTGRQAPREDSDGGR